MKYVRCFLECFLSCFDIDIKSKCNAIQYGVKFYLFILIVNFLNLFFNIFWNILVNFKTILSPPRK
jgi:hypothetical protein